ncbi:MAG: ATP-dependent DNA ligase [Bacteroidia bacterium]|nr:ATP-dependent DNA ligase [Bacteroidia bacterium]MDW8015059.1 ATP-dependent DNA ligase [Bacteroidia bacterium]
MERFIALYQALEQTQSQTHKLRALQEYFQTADPHEAAWVVELLRGKHAKRFVSPQKLRLWLSAYLNLPLEIIEESYRHVGDLSETIALLLPNRQNPTGNLPPLPWLAEVELPQAARFPEDKQREWLYGYWQKLSFWEAFLFHKLLLGAMRVGVAQGLVIRALAEAFSLPEAHVAQRLTANWTPSPHFFLHLQAHAQQESLEPYPFFLAYPIEELGPDFQIKTADLSEYLIEWKWDGVRVQLVRRGSGAALWSRGGVCLTESFPEVISYFSSLPSGTVLDGELLIMKEDIVQPFSALQTRLMRKRLSSSLLKRLPATIFVYDLLEWEGRDLRSLPLTERRQLLEEIAKMYPFIQVSPLLPCSDWTELEVHRNHPPQGAEGLMLKKKDSPYLVGRRRGYWWKYKRRPFTVDAVLVYAQRGHGRRSGWYTDLTFALWDENAQLVTFAKAYSGLTDAEMQELTRWIRLHKIETIGPIVRVPPFWVFEIGFEGIQASNRHKCGYAVRFPRILRWRRDKKPEEADTLQALRRYAQLQFVEEGMNE